MKKIFPGLFLFLALSFSSHAQQVDTVAYRAIAKGTKEGIKMRWAPLTPQAWLIANRYGYFIERYTIVRNQTLLKQAEKKILTPTPLLPAPLEEWEQVVARDSIALVAAQAIHGEQFEIENAQNSIASFINASREQENRYSFALFAADMSWETALASALAWQDREVVAGERYLYKIYPAIPGSLSSQYAIDTAYVYLGADERLDVNGIQHVSISFSDRTAILKWPYKMYEGLFSAYVVERSDDGEHFEKITPFPVIMPENTTKGDGFIYWQDSIPQNNKEYYYRVRGITPFGELSPPSKIVSGHGYKPLEATPYITKAYSPDNISAIVHWTFPAESESTLSYFVVERALQITGPFKEISPHLAASAREYTTKETPTAAYYRIRAVGKEAGYSHSYPILVQLIDSLPPAAPTGLQGFIDTTGVVHLQWQPSQEEDIYGYRVYRANGLNEEFSQVTTEPLRTAQFTDTLSLNTLTKHVYYKVVALDKRFNPSDFSAPLVLKRPDRVPPSPPVFYERINTPQGPAFKWHASPDEDVAFQMLYRKGRQERSWRAIAKLPPRQEFYTDTSATKGFEYWYTIVSVDSSYLESKPAQPVSGKKLDTKVRPPLSNIQANADRQNGRIVIKWEYEPDIDNNPLIKVESFLIYRSLDTLPLEQFVKINGDKRQFIDRENLIPGHKYNYKIKAVFSDGSESPLTQTITINW